MRTRITFELWIQAAHQFLLALTPPLRQMHLSPPPSLLPGLPIHHHPGALIEQPYIQIIRHEPRHIGTQQLSRLHAQVTHGISVYADGLRNLNIGITMRMQIQWPRIN